MNPVLALVLKELAGEFKDDVIAVIRAKLQSLSEDPKFKEELVAVKEALNTAKTRKEQFDALDKLARLRAKS